MFKKYGIMLLAAASFAQVRDYRNQLVQAYDNNPAIFSNFFKDGKELESTLKNVGYMRYRVVPLLAIASSSYKKDETKSDAENKLAKEADRASVLKKIEGIIANQNADVSALRTSLQKETSIENIYVENAVSTFEQSNQLAKNELNKIVPPSSKTGLRMIQSFLTSEFEIITDEGLRAEVQDLMNRIQEVIAPKNAPVAKPAVSESVAQDDIMTVQAAPKKTGFLCCKSDLTKPAPTPAQLEALQAKNEQQAKVQPNKSCCKSAESNAVITNPDSLDCQSKEPAVAKKSFFDRFKSKKNQTQQITVATASTY